MRLLRGAVDATQGEDGWSKLGAVGSHVGNQGSFDPRNHGYRKLSDLIEAIGLFEVRRQGQVIEVRTRKPGRTARATKAGGAAGGTKTAKATRASKANRQPAQ